MAIDVGPGDGLRERKKTEVRRTILKAAERCFRDSGYETTTIEAVADAANVARKTLFNYFNSKEGLLMSLVDSFVGEHVPEWLEPEHPVHHDARDIVAANADKRLKDIADHRWLLEMAANHTGFFTFGRMPYIAEKMRTNSIAREKRIAAVQQEGGMRSDVPPREISAYYEALRDLTLANWLRKESSTPDDLRCAFHNAMRVLIQGLQVPASRPGETDLPAPRNPPGTS